MSGETLRILIAEDEPTVSDVVSRYLAREGFNVVQASDGERALKLAREHPPDLVVLDLMLPKIDGLEVLRELRHHGPLPVIIVTAKGRRPSAFSGWNSEQTTTSPSRSVRVNSSPGCAPFFDAPTETASARG